MVIREVWGAHLFMLEHLTDLESGMPMGKAASGNSQAMVGVHWFFYITLLVPM